MSWTLLRFLAALIALRKFCPFIPWGHYVCKDTLIELYSRTRTASIHMNARIAVIPGHTQFEKDNLARELAWAEKHVLKPLRWPNIEPEQLWMDYRNYVQPLYPEHHHPHRQSFFFANPKDLFEKLRRYVMEEYPHPTITTTTTTAAAAAADVGAGSGAAQPVPLPPWKSSVSNLVDSCTTIYGRHLPEKRHVKVTWPAPPRRDAPEERKSE